MKKVFQYIYYVVFPVILIFIIGILYRKFICNYANSSDDANFICEFKWKDGFILICSYAIVKLISPLLGFDTSLKRILITIGLYIFTYSLIAWPFMLASFFQPFLINTFVHTIIVIILIETFFPHSHPR